MTLSNHLVRAGALVASLVLAAASGASAAPTEVTIAPAERSALPERPALRPARGGKGTGPFSATLTLDGVPLSFTSGSQNTTTTDGITSAGFGGFNRRGFSLTSPGTTC